VGADDQAADAREALARSEARFRALIENAPDAIGVMREGVTLYANPRLASFLGYDDPRDVVGTSVRDRIHPDDLETFDARTKGRAPGSRLQPQEYRILRRDGEIVTAEISSMPIEYDGAPALVCFLRDTTERARLKAQLAQAERLVTIGTLAAGVVHEINNPLSYVVAGLELLATRELPLVQREIGEGPGAVRLAAVAEILATVREGVDRVRDIARDLKTFACVDERPRAPVDVRRVMDASIQMASNEIRHRAKLVKRYADVPSIDANESRLGQVFLNLLLNAAQAMDDAKNGDRREIRVDVSMDDARRVIVAVSDDGKGMDAATRARIFDPFFTTKSNGEGMGLGLSIVHGIVTSFDGSIDVQSAPGKGSTFRMVFPASARATTKPPRSSRPFPANGKVGRVLVVDDDPAVGRALRRMLDPHEVVVAEGGAEAMEILARDRRFDVIVCDLMMPDVSGIDLYESISKSDPELARRIVFMSGGAFTPRARAFLDAHVLAVLDKPCDSTTLHRAVAAMLG
jgi:PAS domain S-box-containing protein